MLTGKKILVGVSGSIAAYKAAVLVRLLIRVGADVRVLMTPLAKAFITPLTLATLSKHPVLTEFFNAENGDWNNHVDLGMWADAFVIAPASANTMAKMAGGIADNLLLTTYLSARCPVFIAPAMDLDMLNHPATRQNLEILQSRGHHLLEPASGELASGLIGKGRMEEPEIILEAIAGHLNPAIPGKQGKLAGKKILVTAGPTHEPIDPVRFIGNHSSGKMGYALAEELAGNGALVELVSGPVALRTSLPGIHVHNVHSAIEMYDACMRLYPGMDGAIMAAAVADYSPVTRETTKIKRTDGALTLVLKPNPDIAETLGKMRKPGQFLAGFALETENGQVHAAEKLRKKNFDFIVLNMLTGSGTGFHADTNQITIIDRDNKAIGFELKSKKEAAADIVRYLVESCFS